MPGLSLFYTAEEEEGPMAPREPSLPAVNPAWLTPLCDANTETDLFVWHRLVYDGTSDLDPEPCGTDVQGGRPAWTDHEDDLSLDTIMSPAWTHTPFKGHDFGDKWLRWGLEHGIAPGQPFLVRIGKPQYNRCSYEYEEYDCEYDAEVVRVMPQTHKQALRAWARVLKDIQHYMAVFIRRRDRLRRLQDTDASAFSLKTDVYYGHGYYDEMTPPTGLRVHLCSAHSSMWGESKSRHPVQLVSGEDKHGDYKKAFRDLLRNVTKHRPGIQLNDVASLAQGRAGITRWEHLTMALDDERCT